MYHDSTYKNRALIPLWTLHLIFLLLLIFVFAVDMMEVAGDIGYCPPALSAFMFFFCVALIMEPLEMVLQSYRFLEPWLYLSFQVYKCLLSTAFFAYEIYGYTKLPKDQPDIWRWVSIIILSFIACLTITYYASLLYGAMVLRRHRRTSSDWDFVKDRSNEK